MSTPPFSFDYMNAVYSTQSPNTLRVSNNNLRFFFERYLWMDLYSVIKWTLPENWSETYYKWCIYVLGVACIVNTDKFGIIPQNCTLGGLNVQYQPSYVLVSNPLLRQNMQLYIDVSTVIIHPNLDYYGFGDLVGYYADMMAICAESCGMNMWNSKLSYILAASNKAVSASLKKMFDEISAGNPAVVIDEELINKMTGKPNWFPFDANVGHNYIADKLLADLNKIIDMFHTEIGIPNANTDKRERLITDEVNANNVETSIKIDSVVDRLNKQCEKARKMFGIPESQFKCEWRFENHGNGGNTINALQPQPRSIQ